MSKEEKQSEALSERKTSSLAASGEENASQGSGASRTAMLRVRRSANITNVYLNARPCPIHGSYAASEEKKQSETLPMRTTSNFLLIAGAKHQTYRFSTHDSEIQSETFP
ncbi:hypothetical protein Q3V53_00925 [Acinetobacter sp. NIPH 1865]|uniref:Uncharacterized protein n=1 Tax=Acinetobacter genomosp. 15BJ TaxID=106651 RepID=A0ABT8URX0_9GAMM|nr:hypothetical protein [Acinetobacter genomosp. 15BJ]